MTEPSSRSSAGCSRALSSPSPSNSNIQRVTGFHLEVGDRLGGHVHLIGALVSGRGDAPTVGGAPVAVVVERGAVEHEVEVCNDHAVLQVPRAGGLVAVDVDLGMGDPVFGEHVCGHGRAHELDQRVAVGETVFLTERTAVVTGDVLGQRVREVVPVLGVQCPQVPVLHPLDVIDIAHAGGYY